MKKHLFIIFILITGVLLCAFIEQGEEQQCCYLKEHFKDRNWYKPLLLLLAQENKIDTEDARMMQASINSIDRMNKSVQQSIKSYGKLEETDIKLMCDLKENDDSIIYVFTQASVYMNMFTYNSNINSLTRNIKKGVIVVTGAEELVLKENNDSSMVFWAQRKIQQENVGWTKYFCYDKRTKTYYHLKNCRIVNNKEECKTIRY